MENIIKRIIKAIFRIEAGKLGRIVRYIFKKNKSKIFVVGLSKTGTMSLAEALRILGYSTVHYPTQILKLKKGKLLCKHCEIVDIDAIADTPTARFYEYLDKKYPNSKYILSERDIDNWLESCKNHFFSGREFPPKVIQLHRDLYDTTEYDKVKFKKAYNAHMSKVLSYFKDRENDLLIINICAGEGWNELCAFLGKPIINEPFPRRNVTEGNRFAFLWNDQTCQGCSQDSVPRNKC